MCHSVSGAMLEKDAHCQSSLSNRFNSLTQEVDVTDLKGCPGIIAVDLCSTCIQLSVCACSLENRTRRKVKALYSLKDESVYTVYGF